MLKSGYYKPTQDSSSHYHLFDENGNDHYGHDQGPAYITISTAVKNGQCLYYDSATERWSRNDMSMYSEPKETAEELTGDVEERSEEHLALINQIHNSVDIKPEHLYMDDLVWKYLIRSIVRGKNVMFKGPTGSGKTSAAIAAATVLEKPLFTFEIGNTQDPRSALLGNTHFDKQSGTVYDESDFIQAIQTPNAVILLDEVSRAHPEALNILMSITDPVQRSVRLDEKQGDDKIIKVHPTVSFVGTANEGHEYSSTRMIDRALDDRFVTVNMDYLNKERELKLIQSRFSTVPVDKLDKLTEAVSLIRKDVASAEGRLMRNVSTRYTLDMASLLSDGFTLSEAFELVIFPSYDDEGGLESDRTYVKQMVQKVFDGTENDSNMN